ncbi:hypothetical protein [Aureivirga sp. CE67]|uniref:hypothetical protein n=1 Tax=Aureivirga sp. CE67 TaxID=1788983 RepID=UPI0018CA44DC|nr:hypothetical protein [Aureivirga sp. CE67]
MKKPLPKIKFCTYNNSIAEEGLENPKKKVLTTEEMNLKRQNELELKLGIKKYPYVIETEKAINQGLYLNTNIEWFLFRHKDNSFDILGSSNASSGKINDIITSDYVLELLNSNEKIFDFEYSPKEKDALYISESYEYSYVMGHERPSIYKYMSFKFENNQWGKNRISQFERFDNIAKGKIQLTDL